MTGLKVKIFSRQGDGTPTGRMETNEAMEARINEFTKRVNAQGVTTASEGDSALIVVSYV